MLGGATVNCCLFTETCFRRSFTKMKGGSEQCDRSNVARKEGIKFPCFSCSASSIELCFTAGFQNKRLEQARVRAGSCTEVHVVAFEKETVNRRITQSTWTVLRIQSIISTSGHWRNYVELHSTPSRVSAEQQMKFLSGKKHASIFFIHLYCIWTFGEEKEF